MAETFEQLNTIVADYLPKKELKRIKAAYDLSLQAHDGQARHSGDPYIIHPLNVAIILAELKQDAATICAGLLHDTVEDTALTSSEIAKAFGDDVCQLVKGVTKLGKFRFDSKEAEQAENFRKMFLAMAEDIRVVIIKLADRLHNMRTLQHLRPDKQRRIARETRDIFAPLAHRMGMWSLKWELEDLAFMVLQKKAFEKIKTLISSHRSERERYVERFIGQVRLLLDEAKLKSRVMGRPKHFYSIYQKLQRKGLAFEDLYDLLGIRIFVETVSDCYQVMGILHGEFKPISGRIKDYIAVPKSNLYQSLHTTVMGPEGKPIEIQIRTFDMHQVAEYGVAAHWQYKDRSGPKDVAADFSWLKEILDFHYDPNTPDAFLKELKLDLFIDEVFVFTPNGDIHVLPKGSGPVDFAYRVHTEVGHSCVGAKVNDQIVPLDSVLKNGDRVQIMTSKSSGPKLDWIEFVKTAQAKNRVRQWFRKRQAQETLLQGKRRLEKTLMVSGLPIKSTLSESMLGHIVERYPQFSIESYDDIYRLVGQGDLPAKELLVFLRQVLAPVTPKASSQTLGRARKRAIKSSTGIRVLGEDSIDVRVAKCCGPLPGDKIIGFITLGNGVSVHRGDCHHIITMDTEKKARLVDVQWVDRDPKRGSYPATLVVEAFNREGILQDILEKATASVFHIEHVSSKHHVRRGTVTMTIRLEVPSSSYLSQLFNSIQGISDVVSVHRI